MHRRTYLLPVLLLLFNLSAFAQEAEDPPADQGNEVVSIPPIYLASKQGKLQKVKELIAMGTDVNTANANGRTALMVAVFYGNKSIVRELLAEGVDIDAVDGQGRTALMMAIANKKMDMVGLLLASGADVAVEDNRKQTAVSLVEKSSMSKSEKKALIKTLESAAE